MGYSPRGCTESDVTERRTRVHTHTHTQVTNVDSSLEQLNRLMRSVDSGRGCACVGAGTILKLATQFCCGPKIAPINNAYF